MADTGPLWLRARNGRLLHYVGDLRQRTACGYKSAGVMRAGDAAKFPYCRACLAAIAKAAPVQSVRITCDPGSDNVDDVAISGGAGSLFRLERMSDESYWVAFYPSTPTRGAPAPYAFMITGRKLTCKVWEKP